jgi:hypothetical protein
MQFMGSMSDTEMNIPLRQNTALVGKAGSDVVVCGNADYLRTPAIFRKAPINCQIVTYGCNCINAVAYMVVGTTGWSISPMFIDCFVLRMPDTPLVVTLTWIAEVRRLEGDLCDGNELVGMYTSSAEGALLLRLSPMT